MPLCRNLSLVLLFFVPFTLSSQIFPKEGSKLNYRIIGFSFPQLKDARCKLEIARGNYSTAGTFNKNIITSTDCASGNMIAEVPSFGCDYTWLVKYAGKHTVNSDLHHFSTLMSAKVDTAIKRLRIASAARGYKDAYIFLDGTRVLYDMSGNPVWFLPDSSFSITESTNVRDIKLSPFGTITFLTDDEVYEINYDGAILWKGPNTGEVSGAATELYHHEFTRLQNGHYMALGGERPLWKLQRYDSSSEDTVANPVIRQDSFFYQRMQFGTVIEYDEHGKVVWSWKSSDYFKESDLYKREMAGGLFDTRDVHENSFFFDEKAGIVYVSFRDISRLVKVNYRAGTISAVYGNAYEPGMEGTGNELFCGQHSIGVTQDGYLYLFNNNALAQNDFPKLIMMQEPREGTGELIKIWEYTLTLEGLSEREQNAYNKYTERLQLMQTRQKSPHLKQRLTSGGSVTELPDRSFLASMNGPFSKIFIINRNKEIMWNAVPERRQSKDSLWNLCPTYKANIITGPKSFEQLIWNGEAGKVQVGSQGKKNDE